MNLILLVFLALVPLACTVETPKEDANLDFNAGEHLVLGDEAFATVCKGTPHCPRTIFRKNGEMSYTYGELVAFGGDFYDTVESMYLEKKRSWWRYRRNDIVDTKKLFYKSRTYIEALRHGHEQGEYPDYNVSYSWNFPNYIQMSEDNLEHFGFHNVLRYVEEHRKALDLARQAHKLRNSKPQQAQQLLAQAFFFNGFADHFLTDGFAAGHIRNPRLQIKQWALDNGLGSRDAGILTKILHDRDGEVIKSGAHGLPVLNSRGDSWFARCDAQLFYNYDQGVKGVNIAVEAVARSIQEVLDAYEGRLPDTTYKALELVPFPDPAFPTLYEIFYEGMTPEQRKDILASIKWYFKIPGVIKIKPAKFELFMQNLPHMMKKFRDYVTNTIKKPDTRIEKIPAAYLEAYQDIR